MSVATRIGLWLAALFCAAAPAGAEPALWSVGDADSTVYLFGTAHAVRPGSAWRSAKVDRALAASTDLWLEIGEALDADPAAMAAVVRRHGMDPATGLSHRLTPAQNARLAAVLKGYGLAPDRVEGMRPWLAAVTIGTLPFAKAGVDPAAGADRALRAAAVGRGERIHGFETAEEQLLFLAGFPDAEQVDFLMRTIDEAEEGPKQIAEISDAWERGDLRALSRIVTQDMRREEPQVYDRLIVRRNIAWAARIRRILAGRGTAFVAVGVGHLVGPDSVQAQLAKAGLRVVRR